MSETNFYNANGNKHQTVMFQWQSFSLGAAVSCSMLIRTIFVWVTHAEERNILSLLLQSLRRIAIQIQYIFFN